jgi:microcystin-dependent protein
MINRILIISILLITFDLKAQVGLDETNPNPFSIIDMRASNKGMIVPRMTTNQRAFFLQNCNQSCPDGLLVFDTDKKAFYYLIANLWHSINPFTAPDEDVAFPEAVSSTASTNADLQIKSEDDNGLSMKVSGKSHYQDSISVEGSIYASKHLRVEDDIRANNRITSGSTIKAGGEITAPNFSSNSSTSGVSTPIPPGTIVMWSGSTVPAGWALCNGTNGPDMRGQFLVASGSRKKYTQTNTGTITLGTSTAYNVNTKSGVDEIQLSATQMPEHTHSISMTAGASHTHEIYFGGWNSGGIGGVRPHLALDDNGCCSTIGIDSGGVPDWKVDHGPADGAHSHDISVSSVGAGTGHTNLPPYYVLAFIIKL